MNVNNNIENENEFSGNSINILTSINETETFLTKRNIELLAELFNTPQSYARHVGCLCVLRDLVYAAIEDVPNPTEHKLFPLFETLNKIISSLLRMDINFDNRGRAYYWKDKVKVFI